MIVRGDCGRRSNGFCKGLLLGCELASPTVTDIAIAPDLLKREDAQLARLEQAIEDEVESDSEVENVEVGDGDWCGRTPYP